MLSQTYLLDISPRCHRCDDIDIIVNSSIQRREELRSYTLFCLFSILFKHYNFSFHRQKCRFKCGDADPNICVRPTRWTPRPTRWTPRWTPAPSPPPTLPPHSTIQPYEEFSMMDIMINKINDVICTGKPLHRCQSAEDPRTTSNCAAFVQETKAWWEAYPKNVYELLNKAYLRNIGLCTPRDIKELKEVLLPQIEMRRQIAQIRMDMEKKIKAG